MILKFSVKNDFNVFLAQYNTRECAVTLNMEILVWKDLLVERVRQLSMAEKDIKVISLCDMQYSSLFGFALSIYNQQYNILS